MQYHGKLYGKIAGMYFDTGSTSDDFDQMQQKLKEQEEKLRWILVEEKDAPHGIVQMKLENGETIFGHFTDKIKTTCKVFEFIKVTHYRELSFYN